MKESVAIAKEADTKKDFSPTKSDNSIHRVLNEPEKQLGSLRSVIGNIRRDGGTPSADSIATELSGMHTAERAPALLALQRTHGNRYVQRVVSGIQAKLKVGQPGDIYEQEADRVADAVMRMPERKVQRQVEPEDEEELIQTKPLAEPITPPIQRQVEEEEEEELIRTKALSEQITPLVQRQEEEEEEEIQTKPLPSQTSEVVSDVETSINSIRGGGQPLPGSTRAFFEPRFGHDFSQVRVHTDVKAAESARAVNARAFTVGQDVVFGAGEYAPGTAAGQRLLAHELTHVVQQAGDKVQRQRHGDRQIGVAITHGSRESIQRQVKDVRQTELANFFSQPEPALPKNLVQKYLTNPVLMAIQRKVILALVDRVQKKQAPLTANQFLTLVRGMTSDDGTALLVCHNVTKALARGQSPIDWKNISRDPLVYSLSGKTFRFDPSNFPEDAVEYGTLGTTVFYAMFSAAQFGSADEGDWYHYFVTATAAHYAASSKLTYDIPQGADITGASVRNVAANMQDKSIKDSAAYRGWRFANALSFLEGAGYGGSQKEVDNESRVHLQGASAGLAAVGRTPGENWKWYVPKRGSLLKVITGSGAGGVVLSPDTVEKTLTGIEGRFRIIIVNATTPDKWYDTPDPYVEYENSFLGRLLAGGGSTSVKKDTTKPFWNEHLVTLDYDVLRRATLKMTDEDHISDDPIVQFTADLRPAGLRVKTFLLKASGSTLRVRVEAEGDIVLKGG